MRESANYVASHLSGALKVVEIGVRSGHNALRMLAGLNIDKLYLVDPYTVYSDCDDVEDDDLEGFQEKQDAYYAEMVDNMAPYTDKVVIVKDSSVNAAATYDANTFDYIYIDGCRNQASVDIDITSWISKLKTGGVMGGHDYDSYPGVKAAVDAYATANGISITVANGEFGSDWWFVKA